ncbi:SaV-like [uncultured Caudovirales phage]|uniref:SaV-like n=1 Tax=uncultured Caudovirales phage TaxID=2100421 RepID=A0A6J5SI01_9CAUD|nr:SaV-like [uncultured Caudovirales phage]
MKITNHTKFKKGDRLESAEHGTTLLVQEVCKDGVVFFNEKLALSKLLPTTVLETRLKTFKKIKVKPVPETKLRSTAVVPEKAILNPDHYRKGAIEPWDFIVDQGLNYLAGNVVKYISRYKHKNGVEDLKKAKTYLEKLISIEERSK